MYKAFHGTLAIIMNFSALAQELERVCESHRSHDLQQRKHAENWLIEFRQSSRPYDFSFNVLNNPLASEYAKFQVLSAVKEAFLREWDENMLPYFIGMQNSLFQLIQQKHNSESPVVIRQCVHLVAIISKRNWLSHPQSTQLAIGMINSLLEDPETVSCGFDLFSAYLDEFSSSKGSFLGMSLEFHFQCHTSFEKQMLGKSLTFIFSMLSHMIGAAGICPQTISAVHGSLNVISQTLRWKFDEFSDKRKLNFLLSAMDGSFDDSLTSQTWIQPGAVWRDLFLSAKNTSLVLGCYPVLRADAVNARLVRCILLQLCSMRGTIYATESSRVNHCALLIKYVLEMCSMISFDVVSPTMLQGEEILDMVQIFQRLVDNFQLECICQCPDNLAVTFLGMLRSVSLALLGSSLSEFDLDTWSSEAFDLCVDTLVSLIVYFEKHRSRLDHDSLIILKLATADIFSHYVQRRLGLAQSLATDEDAQEQFHDQEYVMDRLVAICYLARVHSEQALSALSEGIEQRTRILGEYARESVLDGGAPRTICVIQEELYWLISLLTHVLADPSSGECPVVPALLREDDCTTDLSRRSLLQHVWARSANAVFSYIEFEDGCLASGNRLGPLLSPLVGQVVVKFLQQWTPAYILPQEAIYDHISPVLWRLYGDGSNLALPLLARVVRKVSVNLFAWTHEWELCMETCSLVKRLLLNRKIRRELLELSEWNELVRMCTEPSAPIWTANLPGEVVTALFSSLASAVQGGKESMRQELWLRLCGCIGARLQRLLSSEEFALSHKTNEFVSELSLCLDMLRGIAGSSVEIQCRNVVFEFVSGYFSQLTSLLALYKDRADIATSVLHIFCDLAQENIIVLPAEQAQQLFQASLNLLQEYGNTAHTRLSLLGDSSAALGEEDFEDVRIMLQLLEYIYSKDSVDFGPDNVDFSSDAAIAGISILVSYLNENILSFPSISELFFRVVQDVVSTHPDKLFSILDSQAQNRMLSVLVFALGNHDPKLVCSAFGTIREIVSFAGSRQNQVFNAYLPRILEVLMKRLIEDEVSEQTIDSASDCLLSILVVYPHCLESSMEAVACKQKDSASAQLVRKTFQELVQQSTLGSDAPTGRRNRIRFRKCTSSFVEGIRRVTFRK